MKRINVLNPSLHGKRITGEAYGIKIEKGEIFFDGKDYYLLSNHVGWDLKRNRPKIAQETEHRFLKGYYISELQEGKVVLSHGVDLYLVGTTSSYIPFL